MIHFNLFDAPVNPKTMAFMKDYIKIEYNGSNLYILATQLDALQKYAGSDAAKPPKLNKLGGQDWQKTKKRVKSAVKDIAKDLVALYAERQATAGFQYGLRPCRTACSGCRCMRRSRDRTSCPRNR